MEVAGLAIGVAGLAGLFSTCLEAVTAVQNYVDYRTDLHMLKIQLRAIRTRFETWGKHVGFTQGKLAISHHPALDNQQISPVVHEILEFIRRICKANDSAPVSGSSLGLHRARPLQDLSPDSRRQKVAWALWGKKESTEQVECLDKLVQHLHNLVPVDVLSRTRSMHGLNRTKTNALELASGTALDDQTFSIAQPGSTITRDYNWRDESQRILTLIKDRMKEEFHGKTPATTLFSSGSNRT